MPHPAVGLATGCLRRAETLAGTARFVSGPADVAPDALSTRWVEDWIERAKKALESALESAKRDADESKERARQIAENIKEGAEAINPFVQARKTAESIKQSVTEGTDAVSEKLSRGLERVIAVAKKIILYTGIGIGALILVWLGFSVVTGWAVTKTAGEATHAVKEYVK